jgi:photoactive yellow protein
MGGQSSGEGSSKESPSTDAPVEEGKTSIERAERATEMAAPEEASVPLRFEANDLDHHLAEASEEDLNKAAFGVIRLDEDGVIQFYSKFEQRLSGYSSEEAVGRSFFEEVAPCTDSDRFSGKFFRGVQERELDEMFTYTFTYRMEPLIVKIRLLEDKNSQYYVLVDAMR